MLCVLVCVHVFVCVSVCVRFFFERIFYYNFFLVCLLFLGSVPDPMTAGYTTATLPQYASGLYAPASLPNNAISTVASVVAGKQIEGM